MNKSDELRLLEDVADKLDPLTTYCGAWIREQLPAIRRAMDCDLPPNMAAVSFAAAVRIVREAYLEAARIVAEAQEEAAAKKAAVDDALADQLDKTTYVLNSAVKKLWEIMAQ